MKKAYRSFLSVLIFLFVSGFSSGQYNLYWSQLVFVKTYLCHCNCVTIEIRCNQYTCDMRDYNQPCRYMFRDDCTDSGFGDPCYNAFQMCEVLCAP
ncbi:hypothetical protein APED_27080 [Acanthopleuribacter pedis]